MIDKIESRSSHDLSTHLTGGAGFHLRVAQTSSGQINGVRGEIDCVAVHEERIVDDEYILAHTQVFVLSLQPVEGFYKKIVAVVVTQDVVYLLVGKLDAKVFHPLCCVVRSFF
jgi:hypothetical protein